VKAVMSPTARIARLLSSWAGIGIGVPMLIRAAIGVAPFDVLNTGVAHRLDISLGLCFILNAVVFYGAGRLLGARLGWACVVGTIVIGPMVNFWLARLPTHHAMVPRLLLYAGGIAIIAVAICLVITTELGAGPSEVFMLGLIHRGMPIVAARWISDGLPLVIGAVIGGAIGVGTLVFAVVMGPLVKLGLRALHYDPTKRNEPAHRTPT